MTADEFDARVTRLEPIARRNPGAYKRKVLLLALLGTGYVAAMVVVLVAALILLVLTIGALKALGVKLLFIVGALLWVVVKALWVRVPPPRGHEIRRSAAPELFSIIDDLRKRLDAPAFDHVLLVPELNAAVQQSPRLGILGWHRNYLLIGLPLMKSLDVEQFRAVLAHEFGHLARGHGRWQNWIYRQRMRWAELMQVLEAEQAFGSFLFMPFLRRFVPYFQAYSFPLARQNEYEADATAAHLTSPRAVGQALTNVDLAARFMAEKFWPEVHRRADIEPAPTLSPMMAFTPVTSPELGADAATAWLQEAAAAKTGTADTHPSLPDRLAAIGVPLELSLPAIGQSAERLLGDHAAVLCAQMDEVWRSRVAAAWQERYQQAQEEACQLRELEEKAASAELDVDEALQRARLTHSVTGDVEAAIAQLQALGERAPDNAAVCFQLGVRLLERDDPRGAELLERAIALDEDATLPAGVLLRDYHWNAGRHEESHRWHERVVARQQAITAAEQERSTVWLTDKFLPHGLDARQVGELQQALRAIPGLHKAYLLRKRTRAGDAPLFVLGFSVTAWYRIHSRQRARAVMEAIQRTLAFPGEAIILCIDAENYKFGRKFGWKRGTRIA